MFTSGPMGEGSPVARRWLPEVQVVWLILLVVVAYFLRAGALPIRGEEPTRAQIAREMVAGGDFLVPRQQGDLFLTRPPLQNWLIALSCVSLGTWNEWAVRLPSLIATLLTTLLTYGYARTFLGRLGALAAGLAFATLGDMFQMGRQAETEAVFILLVSASLLVWHLGIARQWRMSTAWSCGYGLMALAMMTKGLQAPLYFVTSTSVYLIVTGQFRRLFTRAHLLGGMVGVGVLGAWLVPFALVVGLRAATAPFFGDDAMKPTWEAWPVLHHLAMYPLELLPGTLPWSLLLLAFLSADFRRSIGPAREHVLFLSVCLLVALPSCWVPTSGQPRFFAPLFPCMACLIGLAAERCASAAVASTLRVLWRRYLVALAWIMFIVGTGVLVLSAMESQITSLNRLGGPILVSMAYAIVALGLGAILLRLSKDQDASRAQPALLAVAGFMVLLFTGFLTDLRLRISVDQPVLMQLLKENLPRNQAIVSLGGHIDCLFPYYYGPPFMKSRPWPKVADEARDVTYFCFECSGDTRPQLPFSWEEIAAIPLDRIQFAVPERVAVVGWRVPTPITNEMQTVQAISVSQQSP